MVGVTQPVLLQQAELVGPGSHEFRRIVAVVLGKAERLGLEPEVLEACRPAALARDAEGMNVVVADLAPVFELDGQLEGALHPGQEIRLVDLQQAMQRPERRYGRLADADRADGIGFHEHDVQVGSDEPGDGGCGGPAGGTATDDDDVFYFCT